MNGDCHNPNLPYNLYLYNNIILMAFDNQGNQGTPKSQKVPRIIAFINNINTNAITYIVTRIIA